jgi:hypothetical protein
MKTAAIFFLALTVLALGMFAYHRDQEHDRVIRGLTTKIDNSQRQADHSQRQADLNLQQKCAEQARKEFTAWGWAKNPMASFENHYNSHLNKCFMLISDMSTVGDTTFTNKNLSDAFEGRSYAEYMWHTVKDKKYWEVSPSLCKVTLPSGEDTFCQSDVEFDDLINKLYMQ